LKPISVNVVENGMLAKTQKGVKMRKNQTERGFTIIRFKDRNGENCSLQASSIATESCIWLGVKNAKPMVCVMGKGWKRVRFPKDTLFTTRMHLNQNQVKRLLPHLIQIAETGVL
jgi:hypothetical protein